MRKILCEPVLRILGAAAGAALAVLAILAGCGGGGGGGGDTTPPSLAGTWDVVRFRSGGLDNGWSVAVVTVDNGGNLFTLSAVDSGGGGWTGSSARDDKTRWILDASRSIAQYDTSVSPPALDNSFHGTLSSSGTLVVATNTKVPPPLATSRLQVYRKRVAGVTYSSADVRGKDYVNHGLDGGSSEEWEYGYGSIDALGRVTQDNATDPLGPVGGYPHADILTLSVDPNGCVTDNVGLMRGFVTADKSAIFVVGTIEAGPPARYRFQAIQMLGGAFARADLGGSWWFHGLTAGGWSRGRYDVSPSTGLICYDNATTFNIYGPVVYTTTEELDVDPSGMITNSAYPSYHGQLSTGKDLYVRTRTNPSPPYYSISLSVK